MICSETVAEFKRKCLAARRAAATHNICVRRVIAARSLCAADGGRRAADAWLSRTSPTVIVELFVSSQRAAVELGIASSSNTYLCLASMRKL